MEPVTVHTGIVAALPLPNVDTDMIAPSEAMKTIAKTGLGGFLFGRMRYRPDGSEEPGFVLNRPGFREASILIAGENFGCGSSREHAVWALVGFGIRVVVAPGFADIFSLNAFRNGLLLAAASKADVESLAAEAAAGSAVRLTVDLAAQEIRRPDGRAVRFDIDPFRKQLLLSGSAGAEELDGLRPAIRAFEERQRLACPWLWP
ncbi:MAG: 3-isopropylmalate dehydratase small subunit [Candidatus Methylomirabilota bacterium]